MIQSLREANYEMIEINRKTRKTRIMHLTIFNAGQTSELGGQSVNTVLPANIEVDRVVELNYKTKTQFYSVETFGSFQSCPRLNIQKLPGWVGVVVVSLSPKSTGQSIPYPPTKGWMK